MRTNALNRRPVLVFFDAVIVVFDAAG